MLRWMFRVTKLDKMRNESMIGTTKIEEIARKVQDRRLKWYELVMRREEHYVGIKESDENESIGAKRRGVVLHEKVWIGREICENSTRYVR